MALRMVVLSIPKREERSLSEEDLKRMGYHGLIKRFRYLKDESMVAKLLMAKSNKWEKILKQEPNWWKANI